MEWTAPKLEEVKMDAEIGSYQEDRRDDDKDVPPVIEPKTAAAPEPKSEPG